MVRGEQTVQEEIRAERRGALWTTLRTFLSEMGATVGFGKEKHDLTCNLGFPVLTVKNPPANAEDIRDAS